MKNYLLSNYNRFGILFDRGEGATLFDRGGKRYIDFASGIGVNSIGYGNNEFSKAVSEQVSKLLHTSNLFRIAPQEELAEKISQLSKYQLFSFFANSGTEANESAIKLVRKYGSKTGRYKIVTLEHSFHGRTYGSLSATGQVSLHENFQPMLDGFSYAKDIEDIYNLIDDKTIGVMVELIQGEGGVEPLPKEEIQRLAQYLKSKDILLIVDEVQTGIYRTGEFLASNYYEIEPDVITLAKGLGGGVPIGVMATKLENGFEAGDHGSTFGGNFLASVAGLKVIEILEKEYKSGDLQKRIELFEKRLNQLVEKFPIYTSLHGIGLMRGLSIGKGFELSTIVEKGLEHGVILLKSGRNRLRFLPPLTISLNEIEEGFFKIEKLSKEILDKHGK
ncbi:MAG TPA: aspartate aminotransferase family protein [Campylobacterales bacterium]|nr:aspartate aminotransferase family protein [Campylobacterales bacterium]